MIEAKKVRVGFDKGISRSLALIVEDCKEREHRPGPIDAVYGSIPLVEALLQQVMNVNQPDDLVAAVCHD